MELKLNSMIVALAFIAVALTVAVESSAINSPSSDEVENEYGTYYGVNTYKPTAECSSVGGVCVDKKDCIEPTSTKSLCGSSSPDAVCCYTVDQKIGSCRSYGGECMKSCGQAYLVRQEANDCFSDETCCVVLN